MATFQTTSIQKDYISTSVTDMSGSFARTRYFHWHLNGIWIDNTTSPPYATATYYTYLDLTPDTQYYFSVEIYDDDDATFLTSLGPIWATTLPGVTLWTWTAAELNAFNYHGNTKVLTAARWNAFVNKINETAIASGSYWYQDYATLANTYMSSGGILTATKFNSARHNIGSRPGSGGTGITDRYPGDIIYGSYFITIGNSLNNWINSLS